MRISLLTLSIAAALVAPPAAHAAAIGEVEPNDTRASAQNINGNFSSDSVEIIFNSTSVPHVTVNATNGGDTDVDYYAFTVDSAGQTGFFDIDGAEGPGSGNSNLHTAMALFDAAGNLLAFDVNSEVDPGSVQPVAGSSAESDSFVGTYTFTAPGTYYVGVTNGSSAVTDAASYLNATGTLVGPLVRPDLQGGGEQYAGNSGPVDLTPLEDYDDGSYILHVSLTPAAQPVTAVPIPWTAFGLMALGLLGFGALQLRRSAG